MIGSVRHMGRWYHLPDGEPVDGEPTPGDCIKLRPLSRFERIEYLPHVDPESGIGSDYALAVMQRGVMAWTLQDEDGEPLPLTDEELSFLDQDTLTFAVNTILTLTASLMHIGNGDAT